MKKLFIIFLFFISSYTFAQQNTLTPEAGITVSKEVSEKLVALALANADIEVSKLQVDVAKYQLSRTKGDWLNNFFAAGNLNEFSINPSYKSYSLYFPKYNFGVSVPLGLFFTQPSNVKIARKNIQIAEASEKSKQQAIREQVLSLYQDYLMYTQLLVIQTQAAENEYTFYKQAEQKFKNGQIQIEDYTTAAKRYNTELSSKIKAQHDLNVTRLQLEQLIGTSLDSVLNPPQKN